MHNKFKIQFQTFFDTLNNHKFLIAASGGLDSSVLIDLCYNLKLDFGICHCNFQLRGQDSDADQKFIED